MATRVKRLEVSKFDRRAVMNTLIKSSHGNLDSYRATALEAVEQDSEFLAHIIAWNHVNGQVRDSKIALPMLALRNAQDAEYAENALAALMYLDPRSLVKAYQFHKELVTKGHVIKGGNRSMLQKVLRQYVLNIESSQNRWTRVALQHRASLKTLYAISHTKPSAAAQAILFDKKYPTASVFAKLGQLKDMSAQEAAGTILNYQIPFQIAIGALQRTKEDLRNNPEFLLALMSGMSGQQLLNSTNFLETMGVFENKMLKSEYDKALDRAKKDNKVSTLKADKAMQHVKGNGANKVTAALANLSQEKIAQVSIDGRWVILGDCSGSMDESVELASEVAGVVASLVKEDVHLIFFNDSIRYFNMTGKTTEQIRHITRGIRADGGTVCGIGLQYLEDHNIEIDGIILVSDGADSAYSWTDCNQTSFTRGYENYCKKFDKEPSIYFLHVEGQRDILTSDLEDRNLIFSRFELSNKTDYYAIPNLVKTFKTTKFGLMDEIMQTPLLTLAGVFNKPKG